MGYLASIFSLLFFIGALLPLFWGVHIVRLNLKSNMHRTFLLLCIALSIWSFGFAMANSASSLANALFWRRFSALGWTSIFSIILQFLLLLVNQKDDGKFNKYLMLIHIPALINMYIFAFSNDMAMIQYNLVKTNYGWTNIAVNNGWDYFHYLYYSLYMILSTVIVWKWGKRIKEERKIRQAKLIFIAIVTAAIPAGLIDLAANTFLTRPLPQMAPLFILLPVWTMYHSARYYDVLNIKKAKTKETIISSEQRKKIFTNFAIGIGVSGILAFVFEYFSSESANSGDLKGSLVKGGILITLGLSIFLIQKIKKESLKEKLVTVVLIASVPIVTFQFLNYSTITVWAYPMIIIISSLLFNKQFLLISTTIVAVITQRLVWIIRPDSYVLVDKYDFILRIILLMVAFSLGFYINKIYLAKIKENDDQIAFQKMLSDVLFEFISLNQNNFDAKVDYLLEKTGRFFNVDRTYLFTINYNNDTMTYSNEWCNRGINKEVGTIKEIPLARFPWWIDQFNKKNLINIEDVDAMPEEARAEQEQLYRQDVKSLVAVPVIGAGKVHAFIGMDSVLQVKKWSEEKIGLLNIMANILSSGITPIKANKETEYMAYYDNLTKLPNRFLFADRVNQAIYIAKRTGQLIAIIFIDLDGFKSVNDTIGHRGGDVLLKQVARSLAGSIRKTDSVARFGGDEFMIMIDNLSDEDVITKIVDKIMKLFSTPFTVSDQEFLVTASAGIAMYPVDGEDSDSLIKNADMAMYKAKSKGKNQYAQCTKEMKDEMQMTMELSNDLGHALERNEFIVHYQPQINLTTNKIIGVEALLRWMHPTRGMISPGIFIPIAEKNNLINSIGEWVLRRACQQNKKWQEMGLPHMKMAVNLSAIQIIKPKIAKNIETIIKETGLDPKYVELEITESIAIEETNYVIDVLTKLKKIGVTIAIDDFGTEYSSLSRLRRLPIDLVKIDVQFVQGIETNEKDKAIIKVIINLAKSLGLNVLAEGVETAEQSEFLKENRCDDAQGYYYYKPMPAEEIEKIFLAL